MQILATNIEWDADIELPSNVLVVTADDHLDSEIGDHVGDLLSDTFGYCHFRFCYSELTKEQNGKTLKDCGLIVE